MRGQHGKQCAAPHPGLGDSDTNLALAALACDADRPASGKGRARRAPLALRPHRQLEGRERLLTTAASRADQLMKQGAPRGPAVTILRLPLEFQYFLLQLLQLDFAESVKSVVGCA